MQIGYLSEAFYQLHFDNSIYAIYSSFLELQKDPTDLVVIRFEFLVRYFNTEAVCSLNSYKYHKVDGITI